MHVDQTTFLADIKMLDSMMAWARQMIGQLALPSNEMRKIEIALEEALVNIINYAYKEPGGAIEILCQLDPSASIEFTIKDKGQPFNPLLQYAKGRLSMEIEEREEGGLGIFLMRSLMDDVRYERQPPYNILTLIKKVS
jgi:anti-sigma regulatory factor (Ser/Thr protein kinase)